MVAAVEFPPSARDFDVYRRIIVYGYSTRQVAGEHHLSQTRVRQLADRVGRWLAEVLPTDEVPEEAGLCLARQLAADRLDFFYTQAMHGWHVGANPRSLGLALRITMAQARLPCIPGRIEALAADVTEGPLPEYPDPETCLAAYQELERAAAENAEPAQAPDKHPPVMDCSASAKNDAAEVSDAASDSAATASAAETLDKFSPQRQAARRAFFATAQREFALDDGSPEGPAGEQNATAHELDLNVEEAIRRQERRRRRRERRRAKAG